MLFLSVYLFKSLSFMLETFLIFLIPSVVHSHLSGRLGAEVACGLVDWQLHCQVIQLELLFGETDVITSWATESPQKRLFHSFPG